MSFRGQSKERYTILLPVDLGEALREQSAQERKSYSEAISEALCLKYAIDPERFGIKQKPRRETVATG